MRPNQRQANQQTINETIANFCSEYNYSNFITYYYEIIDIFLSNNITILNRNQSNNISKFLSSIIDMSLIIYWLNDLERMNDGTLNLKDDLQANKIRREQMVTLQKCMRNLADFAIVDQREFIDAVLGVLSFDSLGPDLDASTAISKFFDKYTLHESQALSKLLTERTSGSADEKFGSEQLVQFQKDLNALLSANYLMVKTGSAPDLSK